ncbi:hypothetical protein HDU97_003994 [Phlyctochytrium planicorne]|nr:hypothetical protein HDU97_003994 [Phlyctochytrium planicorne]
MTDAECDIIKSSFPMLSIPATGCCGIPANNKDAIACLNGHITGVDFFNSSLTGFLPKQIGRLERLETLNLAGNRFVGPIPEEWKQLSYLKNLILYENSLSGSLPLWLDSLQNLNFLYLQFNLFNGPIPNWSLPNLTTLGLAGNFLNGKIPSWVGIIPALYLENNCFADADLPRGLSSTNQQQRSASECISMVQTSGTQTFTQTSSLQPTTRLQTSSTLPPSPTIDTTNSPPPVGLIAGSSIAGVLLLVTLASVAFIFWKRRNSASSNPKKDGILTQSGQHLQQSESGFLVSNPDDPSSSRELLVDVLSERTHGELQRSAMSSSVMKSGGLFPAMTGSGVLPSAEKRPDGLFSGGIASPQADANTAMASKGNIMDDLKNAGKASAKAWPVDVKSPLVMLQQEGQISGSSATVEVFPTTSAPTANSELIYETRPSDSASLSAPPRGSSMRSAAPRAATTVARHPLSTWSVNEVARWLDNDVGVKSDVVGTLKDLGVDGPMLLTLTENDLIGMGVSQGYARLAILAAVGDACNGMAGTGSTSEVPPPYMGS